MITVLALLRARRGMSRTEFVDYYENRHVPLVLAHAGDPDTYARYYLPPPTDSAPGSGAEVFDGPGFCGPGFDGPGFDVVTVLGFADHDAYRAWLARAYAEDSPIPADEARFLDRDATQSWVVDERR